MKISEKNREIFSKLYPLSTHDQELLNETYDIVIKIFDQYEMNKYTKIIDSSVAEVKNLESLEALAAVKEIIKNVYLVLESVKKIKLSKADRTFIKNNKSLVPIVVIGLVTYHFVEDHTITEEKYLQLLNVINTILKLDVDMNVNFTFACCHV
jgi:hypothetical protein